MSKNTVNMCEQPACIASSMLSFFAAERSFRKAKWLPQARVLQHKPQLLRNFIQRRHDGSNDEFGDLVNGIHPDSLLVERVIAQKSTVHGQLYLTKWRSLAYSDATWETEEDLMEDKVGCLSAHGTGCSVALPVVFAISLAASDSLYVLSWTHGRHVGAACLIPCM